MDLKAEYEKIDDIPEVYRDIFAEKDGKFVLNVQGVKTQSDFDKINEGILKEREDHKKTKDRYRAVIDLNMDPSEVADKISRFSELEEIASSKMDPARISELADERVSKFKTKLEKDVAEKEAMIARYQSREKQRYIHDAVRATLTDAKVISSAHDDALMLAERIFDVTEDGQVLTKDAVGVTPGIGPEAWLKEIQPKRSHWWEASQGTGARGGTGGAGFGTNPWKKDAFNLTEQMRITKENPVLAEQLKKAAS